MQTQIIDDQNNRTYWLRRTRIGNYHAESRTTDTGEITWKRRYPSRRALMERNTKKDSIGGRVREALAALEG